MRRAAASVVAGLLAAAVSMLAMSDSGPFEVPVARATPAPLPSPSSSPVPLPSPSPSPSPSPTPFVIAAAPSPAPVTERCAPPPPRAAVVDPATLSVREKAGLVLVAGIPGVDDIGDPEAMAVLDAGVGGVVLKQENLVEPAQARTLVEDLADAAPLGLLTFVDQEGGRVAHAKSVVELTPSARRLGGALAADPASDAARDAGATIAAQLRAVGVHATLGPVADLDDGPYDGVIGDRSFSADAAVASASSVQFVAGLHERGVMAVAKHFPGYAGAADTHSTTATVEADRAELADDLAVFETLVEEGVDAVMVGHVSYTALGGVPASIDPSVYELLRGIGFDGVAMTDSVGMGAVYGELGHDGAAVASLQAGADVVLANQGSEAAVAMRDAIVDAVISGELPPDRLDEAVTRVMRLREAQWRVAAGCR